MTIMADAHDLQKWLYRRCHLFGKNSTNGAWS